MKKMNVFFFSSFLVFCGLGWLSGWQYSSVDSFFLTSYLYVFFFFWFLGEECCTLLI